MHTEIEQQLIKKASNFEKTSHDQDEKLNDAELEIRLRIFKNRTLPFIRTISHLDILSSLILETSLGIICTVLFVEFHGSGCNLVCVRKKRCVSVFERKKNKT